MDSDTDDLERCIRTLNIGTSSKSIPYHITESNERRDKLFSTADTGVNPFTAYITHHAQRTPRQKTNQENLAKLIQRDIEATTEKDFVRILPSNPYFASVRNACARYGILNVKDGKRFERAFENFKRLLCGLSCLPCILLLNPKNDHLEYDRMIQETKTLKWIEETLETIGFQMNDVIIMDLFPMLTDEWLDHQDQEKCTQAIDEMSQLTVDFIGTFNPQFIIACQCRQWGPRWSSFKEDWPASSLQSSMTGARRREVSDFRINGNVTMVVQDFHPASFLRADGQTEKMEKNEELLLQIFECLFKPYVGPFEVWHRDFKRRLQADHDQQLQSLKNKIMELRKAAVQFRDGCKMRCTLENLGTEYPFSSILTEWEFLKQIIDES